MNFLKKNFTLIAGISIPILMVVVIALSIYLPSLFGVQPGFSFLYQSGGNYYGKWDYIVSNGRLTREEIIRKNDLDYYNPKVSDPKLYIYDVSKNASREISFEDAQNLQINSNILSPDGFELSYGSNGDGVFPLFFGGSRDYNSRYLKGHGIAKKINLQYPTGNSYDFSFIGWITK